MSEHNAEYVADLQKEVVRMSEWAATYYYLLREARDLLWHGDHDLDNAPWKRCPGCDLEQRIDAVVTRIDGAEPSRCTFWRSANRCIFPSGHEGRHSFEAHSTTGM